MVSQQKIHHTELVSGRASGHKILPLLKLRNNKKYLQIELSKQDLTFQS